VVQPAPGFELPQLLHSWKSFTASRVNRILQRSGDFWQPEYYDHLIRDEDELVHAIKYTLENPANAGLEPWQWSGQNEELVSTLRGFVPESPAQHGLEARVTGQPAHEADPQRANGPRPRDTGFQPVQSPLESSGDDPFQYIKSRLGAFDA